MIPLFVSVLIEKQFSPFFDSSSLDKSLITIIYGRMVRWLLWPFGTSPKKSRSGFYSFLPVIMTNSTTASMSRVSVNSVFNANGSRYFAAFASEANRWLWCLWQCIMKCSTVSTTLQFVQFGLFLRSERCRWLFNGRCTLCNINRIFEYFLDIFGWCAAGRTVGNGFQFVFPDKLK